MNIKFTRVKGYLVLCQNIMEHILLIRLDQSHHNSIIGSRAKQCTGAPTYITTHRNKNVKVDKN